MCDSAFPDNQDIIKRILAMPEAKRLVVLLVLAEKGQEKLLPEFQRTANILGKHITLCWDWLARKRKNLYQVDDDFHTGGYEYELYDDWGDIEKYSDEMMDAYLLCLSVIGYVTALSYQHSGESASSDAIQSLADLEVSLEKITLQQYLRV